MVILSNSIIKIDSITYKINDKYLINNVSLDIISEDIVSIVGPNGAGKSTMIKMLSGECQETTGKILFKDKETKDWDMTDLACNRAVLSQSNHLSFPFTVLDIIKMGRYPLRNFTNKKRDDEICKTVLEILDLNDYMEQNYMTLSGGEKQRVQLARVLSQIWSEDDYNGKVLILDEPTSFLDINHQLILFDLLSSLNKKGLTIIMVLHDLNHAIQYSNKIVILKNGFLAGSGLTGELMNPDLLKDVFEVNIKIVKGEGMAKPILLYEK